MKKTTLNLKMIPVVLTLPFFLTGCEEFNRMFSDAPRSPGYESSYSSTSYSYPDNASSYASPERQTQNQTGNSVSSGSSNSRKTTNQSGTVAATVSVPVSTEKKTSTGTVDAPAVPSIAPTVGQ